MLPLVKAYPALSKTYGEVSCIAGIQLEDGLPVGWIRLYPVPFRALKDSQQFAKYQPIRFDGEAHRGDRRPETRRPNRDSIEVIGDPIGAENAWERRRRFVHPLMADSMCAIQRQQARDGTSLGIFRPREVHDVVIEPLDIKQEKAAIAKAWAAQPSLLDGLGDGDERQSQVKALELVPWSFKYNYHCADSQCGGHEQSIIDWEIARTYERVKRRADWQQRLRERWLDTVCAPDRDVAFIVGSMHQRPRNFLVLEVWWPEWRPEQLQIDDL